MTDEKTTPVTEMSCAADKEEEKTCKQEVVEDKSSVPGTAASANAPEGGEPAEGNVEEEVVQGNWNLPDVKLEAVKVMTGEENEETQWCCRSKLFRWREGEWKERGIGDAKLLKDEQGKIRFLLRQEKTGKVVANHYVLKKDGCCELKPNAGSDKIWVWNVLDSAEDEQNVEQFGLKFATVENATLFKEEFNKAVIANQKCFDEGKFQ